jgi:ATP-dependent helicase/nuclease subunit B
VQRLWAQTVPNGFTPYFETTQSWARALGASVQTPLQSLAKGGAGGDDFCHDPAIDSLTARNLLERSGFGEAQNELMPRLLVACTPLAARAAAIPPPERMAWAAQAQAALMTPAANAELRLESAITHLALIWAATSSYATDVLWDDAALPGNVDALIILDGLQDDPLTQALAERFAAKTTHLSLTPPAPPGQVNTFAAHDFEEEALWAASCVLRRVAAWGESPVALVATDRTLTRRIRAMLETQGLAVRDETGWTLSTTRAAATVMSQLQACTWNASSDAVLDALKNAPFNTTADAPALVGRLETLLRLARCNQWRDRNLTGLPAEDPLHPWVNALQSQFQAMQRPRPLHQWLADTVTHLHTSGVWPLLQTDAAGMALITALHLGEAAQTALQDWPLAAKKMRQDEFTAWVRQVLEAASHVPPSSTEPQVVILPLSHLLARPFSAVVIPACDEVRLSPSPELPGSWTTSERIILGLPTRQDGEATLRATWQQALQFAQVDVLYRQTDNGGETLLPSPLLQLHVLSQASKNVANNPCISRDIAVNHCIPPQPQGDALPVKRLSASAYEDLRRCPYRFFALRQLGLTDASELAGELEKRDVGDWLHEVLHAFHKADPTALTLPERRTLIDHCADTVRAQRKFSAGEFLPYQAAWPDVRDGYLTWLTAFEATGARFASGETWHEMGLGPVTLVGRIDRIDTLPAPASADAQPVYLIDYKTEPPSTTKERLKNPLEDTQLAFYGALLPQHNLQAAYLSLNEREGTKAYAPEHINDTREALIYGILDDMQRIEHGAVLAALGEGKACDYCAARGVCRKDFWEVAL